MLGETARRNLSYSLILILWQLDGKSVRICLGVGTNPVILGTKKSGTPSGVLFSSGEGRMDQSFTPLSDQSNKQNTSRTVSWSHAFTEPTRTSALSLQWTQSTCSRHLSDCDFLWKKRIESEGISRASDPSPSPKTSRAPKIFSSWSCRSPTRNLETSKRTSRSSPGVSSGLL